MRFSATKILNGMALSGAATLMVYGALYDGADPRHPGVDPITTASVQAHAATNAAYLGDQFTVINHRDNRACVMRIHRAEGYDVHRVEPSENCAGVTPELVHARTWQENASGTVTLTDHKGNHLMRLSRADGFAWEVIEPLNVAISLQAF